MVASTRAEGLLQLSIVELNAKIDSLHQERGTAEANFTEKIASLTSSVANHLHSLDSNKVHIDSLEKRLKDKDKKIKE